MNIAVEMVKSFNDGTDNGVLCAIEIAEEMVKANMSLTEFIKVLKDFHENFVGKITEEQANKKFNKGSKNE